MTSLEHYRALADGIGPRSGASEEEAKAADYVAAQLTALGLTPQKQTFISAESAYGPYILYAVVGLLSVLLFWQAQPVGAAAAAIIMTTGLISIVLELQFRANPLRWLLPIEHSTNVIADIPCQVAGTEDTEKIVVTARLDVHRQPAVLKALGGMQMLASLVLAAEIAGGVLIVLAVIGVPVSAVILRQIALIPGVVMLALLAAAFLVNRSPYEKGVGDNAGGIAAVLGIAERLKATPLANTHVALAFTGAEEAGCYGAQALFSAHEAGLVDVVHIVVDTVGARGTVPAFVRSERFMSTAASDAELVAVADAIATGHPDLCVRSVSVVAGRSELSLSPTFALPAIGVTSIAGTPPAVEAADQGDPDQWALQRHEMFLWRLLQGIDAAAAPETAPSRIPASATA